MDLNIIHEEYQYLNLIKNILDNGEDRSNRTSTRTLSIFSPPQLRFSLEDRKIPLLTTKWMFFKGVAEELFWFISGSTDVSKLQEKGIHIWDKNAVESNDLGPIYGFQLKHSGADYIDYKTDYSDKGVNQLEYVINLIKTDPSNRRIVISFWNPKDLSKMALPPCHVFVQFYVNNLESKTKKKSLSCHVFQRSGDVGLGVPFNIASYSLLTHMIANITGLEAKELILTLGDAHIYQDHKEKLQEQTKRKPYEFPTISFKCDHDNLEQFKYEDIILENYISHEKIKLSVS
jgi:thymidylate synthase